MTRNKAPIGTVISLFSGAMGFDLGFSLEGFDIRAAVEKDKAAIDTIKANKPDVLVSMKDDKPTPIEGLTTDTILRAARLEAEEPTVIVGAPPCEPYSTAGRRNGKSDHRADAVTEFIRVINQARPRFFAFEEVDSFISAAKKHIPFYDRVARREKELSEDERLGSFFREVMASFKATDYTLSCDLENPRASVLNAADFGLGQKRDRFIVIGVRNGPPVALPKPTVRRWKTLREALSGLKEEQPEFLPFPNAWGYLLKHVPPGGCWKQLSPELQKLALGGAYDDGTDERKRGKKGGRTGFLRRLSWNAPSPTLVDSPIGKATCLCHPDYIRPLSIREYARLQGFPDDWIFKGGTAAKYRLIGQATPVPLSRAVARAIKQYVKEHPE
jgi:DNA (cytosine-5)-methyltransferase 1